MLYLFFYWALYFIKFQGTIATTITQPVDVMKTRLMEARPGQYKVQCNVNFHTASITVTGWGALWGSLIVLTFISKCMSNFLIHLTILLFSIIFNNDSMSAHLIWDDR